MAKEVVTSPLLDHNQRAGIKSFDDALALFAQQGQEITSITDFGDGFEAGADKANFVGVKFLLIDWRIVDGEKSDYGTDFAVMWVVTVDGRKSILTDGSTGVCDQIKTLVARNAIAPIMCEKGLTVSNYEYVDEKGKRTPAKTYYIDGM